MIRQMSRHKNELSRPGFVRIALHFTLTQPELKYITDAVRYVCCNGWKFLPLYDFDVESGAFYRRNWQHKEWRSLLDLQIDRKSGELLWRDNHRKFKSDLQTNFDTYFQFADEELVKLRKTLPTKSEVDREQKVKDKHSWYWLPSEMFPFVVEFAFQDMISPKSAKEWPR